MGESFPNAMGKVVIEAMVRTIQENASMLSEIDGAIGDGDHGINMSKGFTMCRDRLSGQNVGLSEGLTTLGTVLLTEIGGAMGPLYGTFFREMGKAAKGQDAITAGLLETMLTKATDAVVALGQASVGDKTLLDTIAPALEALRSANQSGAAFSDALSRMSQAAEKGKESTRGLVAKLGRASRLGERSRGVLDAGAASSCLLLQAMAASMIELLA